KDGCSLVGGGGMTVEDGDVAVEPFFEPALDALEGLDCLDDLGGIHADGVGHGEGGGYILGVEAAEDGSRYVIFLFAGAGRFAGDLEAQSVARRLDGVVAIVGRSRGAVSDDAGDGLIGASRSVS